MAKYICENCGEEYKTNNVEPDKHFCSGLCQSEYYDSVEMYEINHPYECDF